MAEQVRPIGCLGSASKLVQLGCFDLSLCACSLGFLSFLDCSVLECQDLWTLLSLNLSNHIKDAAWHAGDISDGLFAQDLRQLLSSFHASCQQSTAQLEAQAEDSGRQAQQLVQAYLDRQQQTCAPLAASSSKSASSSQKRQAEVTQRMQPQVCVTVMGLACYSLIAASEAVRAQVPTLRHTWLPKKEITLIAGCQASCIRAGGPCNG